MRNRIFFNPSLIYNRYDTLTWQVSFPPSFDPKHNWVVSLTLSWRDRNLRLRYFLSQSSASAWSKTTFIKMSLSSPLNDVSPHPVAMAFDGGSGVSTKQAGRIYSENWTMLFKRTSAMSWWGNESLYSGWICFSIISNCRELYSSAFRFHTPKRTKSRSFLKWDF